MVNIDNIKISLEIFLGRKNLILKKLTGINYITDEDIKEFKSWDDSDIRIIANNFMKEWDDIYICPWCILSIAKSSSHTKCEICTYGKRHGRCCIDNESTYSKIISLLCKNKILKISPAPLGGQGIIDIDTIKIALLFIMRELYRNCL